MPPAGETEIPRLWECGDLAAYGAPGHRVPGMCFEGTHRPAPERTLLQSLFLCPAVPASGENRVRAVTGVALAVWDAF